MKKSLLLLFTLGAVGAQAGPQTFHPELDTVDCASWGGDRPTNAWTKCAAPKPVETIVEKTVLIPGPERVVYRDIVTEKEFTPLPVKKSKHFKAKKKFVCPK